MRTQENGFTFIELIVVVAIFCIFASVALPDLTTTLARSALTDAIQTTALALRKAKTISRAENTSVSVNFTQNSGVITLTLPDNSVIQTIRLNNVHAENTASYRFNSIGTVNNIGVISLKAARQNSLKKTIEVATLSGQIKSY